MTTIMNFEQFDEHLRAYSVAASLRERKLLIVFFVLLGVAITNMFLLSVLPKNYVVEIFKIIFVCMGCLAIYTVFSARVFHKAHGVHCCKCGASLVALAEKLDMIEANEIERPKTLECPRCKAVVVSDDV